MTWAVQTRRENHQSYAEQHNLSLQEWPALGTTAHLIVTDADQLPAARRAADQVIESMDAAASRFRMDSEVVQLARAGGTWVGVSPMLTHALRVALDAAAWTEGLLDPTVGGVLAQLGYDRTFSLVPEDNPGTVVHVRHTPGWENIELDEDHSRVRVPPGMVIDLGATAKGLAADLASEAAAAASGCGVLVGLGGDISVAGKHPEEGWPVTVTDGTDFGATVGTESEQTVVIHGGGLATSSVRARRWRRGGAALHHIIDPRIGRPSNGIYRTVSVAAPTCTLANTASTAAIILGAQAPGWLEARALSARLVTHEGDVHITAGWPTQQGGPW